MFLLISSVSFLGGKCSILFPSVTVKLVFLQLALGSSVLSSSFLVSDVGHVEVCPSKHQIYFCLTLISGVCMCWGVGLVCVIFVSQWTITFYCFLVGFPVLKSVDLWRVNGYDALIHTTGLMVTCFWLSAVNCTCAVWWCMVVVLCSIVRLYKNLKMPILCFSGSSSLNLCLWAVIISALVFLLD